MPRSRTAPAIGGLRVVAVIPFGGQHRQRVRHREGRGVAVLILILIVCMCGMILRTASAFGMGEGKREVHNRLMIGEQPPHTPQSLSTFYPCPTQESLRLEGGREGAVMKECYDIRSIYHSEVRVAMVLRSEGCGDESYTPLRGSSSGQLKPTGTGARNA